MNYWVRESIEIANGPGYLDRLQEVYPVTIMPRRSLSAEKRKIIEEAFELKDDLRLITELLRLKKFPIKDPYAAFLRKNQKFIEYNPETVKRISERISSMGLEKMFEGIEEAVEFNRTIGPLFRRWLPKLGYPMLDLHGFERFDKGIAILDASPEELRRFANQRVGANLEKRPDILAKNNGRYVIGEAKFLTDVGGHQNTQLLDALDLLRSRSGRVKRVAILDGVVWIRSKNKMHHAVVESNEDVFSALLLSDYLKNL